MGEIFGNLGITWTGFIGQAVNFLLALYVMNRFLYQPIFNMMDERKSKLADSLKDAESAASAAADAATEKSAVMDEARREAQEVRAQATRDAEKIAQEVRSRAEQEATDIRMKAQEEAQSTADNALADVNKQVADLTIQATEKLLGRQLENVGEQRRFVTDFLEKSGSN